MTDTTPTDKQVEERAQALLDHDVFCCQSALVDDLLKTLCETPMTDGNHDIIVGFAIDEIENLYPDPSDWTLKECREYLDDCGHGRPDPDPWAMDRDALAEFYANETGDNLDDAFCSPEWETADGQSFVADIIDQEDIDGLDDWRDAVRDTDPQEIFEWWLVSNWLAGELDALGCPVLRNDYGNWWGRTCTGQAILMDGTLQDVARRILSR
jgi:hypothetical protein